MSKGKKKEMDFRDTDGKDVQAAGPRTRYLGLYSRFSNRPLVDCTLSGTPNLPLTLVAQRTGTRTRPEIPASKVQKADQIRRPKRLVRVLRFFSYLAGACVAPSAIQAAHHIAHHIAHHLSHLNFRGPTKASRGRRRPAQCGTLHR